MSRLRPASEPRHRTRRSSDRAIPVARIPQLSRPYLLEWSTQNCRQKELLNVEEFQEEMLAVERPGWRKLAIVRGECDMGVLIGVELDKKRGGWVWEFPETEIRRRKPEEEDGETKEKDDNEGSDEDEGIRICRASLMVKEQLPILLLDGLPFRISSRPYRPSRVPTQALETNADITRSMERRGEFSTITSADWSNLAERLKRRIQLSVTVALQAHAQQAQDDPKDSNSRSLDRIAYLGGLLLPLTVVSGILSIQSSYGPEGKSFWVFWLASGLSSLLAILIIYADHLRTLDVWMEVAASEILDLDHNKRFQANRTPRRREYYSSGDPERGEAKLTTASDGGVYVVQHRGDGTRGKAWRRGELGWLGAMKKMSGWYRWRGSPGMEFRMPGWERKVKNLVW
ncbi:hypothetical protein FOXG_21270 [Fusarium oxysporum f. sp. lycopersici 4287]|uniref:Uncharacterized protein n=1 Tax=Fusarium oxysporum f. sp. lycopersici (strain 4287 / CBS 123668 / FGSC 9935 / NRRL 34936) TaxID=426428 RepID=A0A0J9VXC5_FUSO4|nr:hypothetical protein FOXG_21270 [Fusarium oxysporum f. sp. lycopersici 4287]KNB15190.1 hypothetical protein FOXG_21270 [Fusarium oxysporum f. sp. lycopersici 4287]